MTRPLGMMSFETFDACVQAAVAGRQLAFKPLELHHFGESLLHPEIARFVRHATKSGVPTQLNCNPGHLAPDLGEELLRAGLGVMVFSFDGMDTPTMQLARGAVANYEKAEERIMAFVEARPRLNPFCAVMIQMVALEANQHQWRAFMQKWRGIPGVMPHIKAFDSWTQPGLVQLGARTPHNVANLMECTFPYHAVVVLWDGRIVPCCHDHDGAVVLGSIHDGLENVWRSPVALAFREDFERGTLPANHMCRRCCWWPGNGGWIPFPGKIVEQAIASGLVQGVDGVADPARVAAAAGVK
jgi:radical SAM protein with 4Fe4S-binding SPASM domain